MDIVKSDNLPHGTMPTVFEDRTLFPTPPVIDARYSERKGSWVLPAVIFGFMLVPLAGLGFFVVSLNNQLGEIRAEGNDEKIEALNAQINLLKEENQALEIQVTTVANTEKAFDRDIGRLIAEISAQVKDIDDLRRFRQNAPNIPADKRTIPDTWDDAAIAILQERVNFLKDHRTKVLATPERRPAGPSQPDIQ